MRVRALLVITLLLLMLPAAACGTQESTDGRTPTPQLVGEWQADDPIISAAATEIDGQPYVLLLTMPGGGARIEEATLHILDARDGAAPEEVASLQTPIDVWTPLSGMAVSGDYLYAGLTGSDASGLWVVDISEPAAPLEVTFAEDDYAVMAPVKSGSHVVVQTSIGFHFALLDVSDPAKPDWIAEFMVDRLNRPQPELISTSKVLSGTNLFIAHNDGLTVFDLSDVSEPRQVSFYANEEWDGPVAEPVEGAGTTTYSITLPMDDIRDVAAPRGSFLGIAVSGDHGFVAASDLGLVVLDVSDTEAISEVTRLELPGRARRVVLSGDYAIVLALDVREGEELVLNMLVAVHVVDISQPEDPRLVTSIQGLTGIPPWQNVVAVGDTVFVTNNNTLHVIDLYAGD